MVMRDVFWMICLLTPVATSISVYSGYSITLTCNITNTDNAILTWEHQDVNNQHSVIAVGNQTKGIFSTDIRHRVAEARNSSSLTITNATTSDQGEYTCSIFKQGGATQKWNLEVYTLPGNPIITQNNTAYQGEMYDAQCLVKGGNPRPLIKWALVASDGQAVNFTNASTTFFSINDTRFSYSKLRIILSRDMQGGRLLCNAYQTGSEEYYNETTTEIITGFLVQAQNLTMYGTNISLSEDRLYRISCTADKANPAANIEWTLESGTERNNLTQSNTTVIYRNGYYSTTSEVVLNVTKSLNLANITCSATNLVAREKQLSPLSSTSQLDVNYRPTVVIVRPNDSNSTTLQAGYNHTITCEVLDSKPPANYIEWVHGNKVIPITNKVKISGIPPVVKLTIYQVNRQDTGLWYCRGRNIVGGGTSKAYGINVQYKPICNTNQKVKYASKIGTPVELNCNVLANPTNVTLKWKKDSVTVSTAAGKIYEEDFSIYNTLAVTPRSEDDYGKYECHAENEVGTLEEPCRLELHLPGPAEAPTNCETVNSTAESFTVVCVPTFDGGSLAMYALMILQDRQYVVRFNQTTPTFNVTGLEERRNYTMIVCSSNSEYWMNQDCTETFIGTTESLIGITDDVVTRAVTTIFTLDETTLYIIVGVTCFIVIVVTVVLSGFCYARRTKNRAKRNIHKKGDVIVTNKSRKQHLKDGNSNNKKDETSYSQATTDLQQSLDNITSVSLSLNSSVIDLTQNGDSSDKLDKMELDASDERMIRRGSNPYIDEQAHSELIEDVKNSLRSGHLDVEGGKEDPEKIPITLL